MLSCNTLIKNQTRLLLRLAGDLLLLGDRLRLGERLLLLGERLLLLGERLFREVGERERRERFRDLLRLDERRGRRSLNFMMTARMSDWMGWSMNGLHTHEKYGMGSCMCTNYIRCHDGVKFGVRLPGD